MMFDAVPPIQPFAEFGSLWHIYARGEIDEEATQRLADAIENYHIPNRSFIYLDSPGGNLFEAMKLGRLIRQHRFAIYIGIKGAEPLVPQPGICLSACALAFLGGPFRFLPTGSDFGVHRFYFTQSDALDSDRAQIVSAAVLQYIRDMGVDQQLFTDMTEAGKDDIYVMPLSRLIALQVVNNGKGNTVWTVESHDSGIYLKGQRDTLWGRGKLLLQCGPQKNTLAATAIFDPWDRQAEIVKMPVILFMIDGKQAQIPQKSVVGPFVNNGWINVAVILSGELVARMKTAKTVGVAVQYTPVSSSFAGFEDMDFVDGAGKLAGLLTTCH